MRGIFGDIVVKVPKQTGVFINWSDKKKVIYSQGSTRDEKGNPKRIGPKVIGYAISATEMHPNTNYRDFFPSEWKTLTGEDSLPDIKRFGINLAVSTICENQNIRSTLNKSMREDFASAVLDFSSYCLLFRDAVIEHFGTTMEDQVLFCEEPHDDEYYYDLFKKQITEQQTIAFRREWAKECIAQGDTDVWICIDGSNNDCECRGVEFVERGFAKSHRNVSIIGYSLAVTERGKPVSYELYRGGLIDQKALKSLIAAMESYGFHVKGVILDRGYCYYNVIEYLRSKGILFIIMMKSNVPAYINMMEKYGNTLRLLPGENWIEGTCLYGASDKMHLFNGSKNMETVCLYYDISNAAGRTTTLLMKISKALVQIRKAISENKKMPAVSKDVQKYLEYVYPEKTTSETETAKETADSAPTDTDSKPSDTASGEKEDESNVAEETTSEQAVPEKGEPQESATHTDHAELTADKEETPTEMNEQDIADKEEEEAEKTDDTDNAEASTDDKNDQSETAKEKSKRPIAVKVKHNELQMCTDKKGFFAIASSESLSPYETHLHYSHRDISETTYMILKGQEGFAEVRVHTGNGINSKFFTGFVTSIIRYYFEQACSELDVPTNEMIRKLNLIRMKKSSNIYYYSDETDSCVKKLLKKFSVANTWTEDYVKAENKKLLGDQGKKAPRKPGPKPGSHHRQFDEKGNEIKRKPGPKPGSHHKQKYNKDGTLRQKPGPKPGTHHIGKFNKDGSERQKPGPKPGSKHKKSGQSSTAESTSKIN